jgi:TDG/mug DNA glycosylase family protein
VAVPDILAPDLAVVFCGINPGATAAASGHNFSSHSNRFWRAIHLAGFTPELLPAQEEERLPGYGCGLTAVVARPTRGAADLTRAELAAAVGPFRAKMERCAPRTIAFLGKPAYAAIVARSDLAWGLQAEPFAGAAVWLLPNPSGLNRAFSLAQLAEAYGALRLAIADDLARFSGPT